MDEINESNEHKIVSLFADFRGFSHMFEVLPAKKIYVFTNRYFKAAVEIVERYNGTFDNIIGDGLMATWGKYRWIEQSPFYAIRTSLEMRMALLRQNVRYKWKSHFPLEIGIGIAMGNAFHCKIGPQNRSVDTVYGKPVILASRLGDLAQNNQIYSGENIARIIKKWAMLERMPLSHIHGFKNKVQFYKVVGLMDFSKKNEDRRKQSHIRFIIPEIIAMTNKKNGLRKPVILKNISPLGAGIEIVLKEDFFLNKGDEVILDLKKFSLPNFDTIDGIIARVQKLTEETDEERSLSQVGMSFSDIDTQKREILEKININNSL